MSSRSESETERRPRFGWSALGTLLLGWGLSALILFVGLRKSDQLDQASFDRSVHTIRELLETHIEKVEGAVGRMQTFATFNNHASQGEWMEMLGSIDPQTNFKYMRELGAARYHPSWSLNAPTNGPWDRMGFVIFRAVGPDFHAAPPAICSLTPLRRTGR